MTFCIKFIEVLMCMMHMMRTSSLDRFLLESLSAVSILNDLNPYYDPETPTTGTTNPRAGTVIGVRTVSAQESFMQVEVRPAK